MLKDKTILVRVLLVVLLTALAGAAQSNPGVEYQPFDVRAWGNVYEIPAMKNVKVNPNVAYFNGEKGALTIDVYMPPESKVGEKRPAVIFLNGIGDRPNDKLKNWTIYKSWARLMAAKNIVGITMESAPGKIQENFRALANFLAADGEKYGIDGANIGVFAASANVTEAMKFLMDEKASPNVRAAVLYYGFVVPEGKVRADLPVLYVVAEGDSPRLPKEITSALWKQVTDAGVPWTLSFAARLPHAFDSLTSTDESRRMVEQAINFWESHLAAPPQPSEKPSEVREIIGAIYGNNPQLASELLTKYLAKNPDSAPALTQYGRMLMQLKRYDESKAAFEKALRLAPNDALVYGGIGQLYLEQGRNEEAAENLGKAVAGGFNNSQIYNQLAAVLTTLNRYDEALRIYEKNLEIGAPRAPGFYNIACIYVRLKQNDKAFEFLSKAIDEGFNNRNTFETDTDLAPLREDARFRQILSRINGK